MKIGIILSFFCFWKKNFIYKLSHIFRVCECIEKYFIFIIGELQKKNVVHFFQSIGSMQFSPVPLTSRNMSPANTPPRRPLPHLMSSSHNGVFTRMTSDNGQNIDIYENPSEHYAGFNSPRHNGSHSPFLAAFRKNNDPDQHSSHGFGKKSNPFIIIT